ncbi:hypothetical protein K8I31_13125, partial [bacterium]|nr:hypothetical protein [bacterium]
VWADLISQATPSFPFSIQHAPRSATASLEMKFYVGKGTPRDFIRSVTPYIDGRRMDWTATSREDAVLAAVTLSSQWLQPGAHELSFHATPASQLQSQFESINLDWLQFGFAAQVRPSTLAYQTPDDAAQIQFTAPSCALWLPNDDGKNPKFAISANEVCTQEAGRLFVVNQQHISGDVRIESYNPSTPDMTELMNLAQTDVILVAPLAWRETLATYRESLMRMGYTVRIASIEAIYDRFGDGRLSPFALREFLRYAYHSWKRPSPSYVLFIGDATWDYKNRYGVGVKNYVPGYRAKPEYAVENWFVRLDSETDKIPDMMIGRWPLRSVGELKTLINKTVRYKESLQPDDWLNHYFLLTDHGFERFTEELEREWIPKGFRLTQRHVADYPLVDNIYLPEKLRAEKRAKTSLAATRDIINILNNGVWLMEFFGHGAPNVVGNERLFFGGGSKFTDVKKLTNAGRPFLFWSFSCETSKFDYPRQKWNISIGEDMLTHPSGGAVGLLGASGRGYPHDHIILARGMHEALYHYGLQSMGQILLAGNLMGEAYQNVFEPADQFCFLGDPTIRLPKFEDLTINANLQQNEISLSAARPSNLTHPQHAAVWIRSGSDVVNYTTMPATDRIVETYDVTDENNFYAGAEFIAKRDGEIIVAHGADNLSQQAPPIIEATTGILPDLVIQPNSLRVSPDAPRSGETIFLDGVITNQGQATAQDIFVQGKQAPLGKKRVPFNVVVGRRGEQIERLDPGESARVRLRWDPTGNKGDYDLELEIDPFNQIQEENEDNNSDETQVTVLRKADLLVEQNHFKLTPIDGGKRYEVSFSILNAGESTVEKFLIEMAYQLKGSSKRLSGFVPE